MGIFLEILFWRYFLEILGDDPDRMVDHFDDIILKASKNLYQRYKRCYKEFAQNGFPSVRKHSIDQL